MAKEQNCDLKDYDICVREDFVKACSWSLFPKTVLIAC